MRRLLLLVAAAWTAAAWTAAAWMAAQTPDFYKTVDRVTWVVDDLDRAIAGWQKTGLGRVDRRQEADSEMEFRGRPARERIHAASGYLGDLRVDWIQPV